MSKWRPSDECLYVIPDVHGALPMLEQILARILPLRTTGGVQDQLVFLGDYVDRHQATPQVLDRLIEIKNKYPNNAHFLMGNHEQMMLAALRQSDVTSSAWRMWVNNGGYQTVVGYCNLINQGTNKMDPNTIKPNRLQSIIPDDHLEFLASGKPFHKHGDFIFIHGGCDPIKGPEAHSLDVLLWDRSLLKLVQELIQNDMDLPWDPVYITGHNGNGRGEPIIKDKFMMLDCGSPKRLLVVELNSNEAFMAFSDKKRLISYELKETVKKKGIVRRLS